MTVYKPRSAWTSTARGGAQLTGTKLVGIAWHWPGTSQDKIGVESEAATANRLRGYRSFHVNTRGWSDIGYNMAIDQAGLVWDLRGLGRVGAHAASASNPDANHEWMGVLLIIGNREHPSAEMIRACQDFTHDVFLPRWPGRTRDTGHGRAPGVPGAQTSCPGPFAAELIVDGELTHEPLEDDMKADEREALMYIRKTLANGTQGRIKHPHNDGTSSVFYGVQEIWEDTYALRTVPDELEALRAAVLGSSAAEIKALIEAKHAEAAQQRQVIADTMTAKLDAIVDATKGADPAEAKLAAILEILGVEQTD